MKGEPCCPRCGVPAREPGAWSSSWSCARHGEIEPLQPFERPGPDTLWSTAVRSDVPVWLPWPLPPGWQVTGVGRAGDERMPGRASVLACSGPDLAGGDSDMIIVAEEVTVGLGAAYAGLPTVDAGQTFDGTPANTKIHIEGHPVPMWFVPDAVDRAVYVGEAEGCWLWVVLHPASAGLLMAEQLELADARALGATIAMVPFGRLSQRVRLGTP